MYLRIRERYPEQVLDQLFDVLRTAGDMPMCQACRIVNVHGCKNASCKNAGIVLSNYLIEAYVPLAMSIAQRYGDDPDIIGVALLTLTKVVNEHERFVDSRISLAITKHVKWRCKRFVQRHRLIRVPLEALKNGEKPIATHTLNTRIHGDAELPKHELFFEIRDLLIAVCKSKIERRVARRYLRGLSAPQIADELAISPVYARAIRAKLEDRFAQAWREHESC